MSHEAKASFVEARWEAYKDSWRREFAGPAETSEKDKAKFEADITQQARACRELVDESVFPPILPRYPLSGPVASFSSPTHRRGRIPPLYAAENGPRHD